MTEINADQRQAWNGALGNKWVTHADYFDTQLAGHIAPLMQRADIGSGDTVVDIGCGFATTTLRAAELTGSGGTVQGVDISGPMIAEAQRRAAALAPGGAAISFVEADCQTHAFAADAADVMISRYGVMFYDQPDAAFANIRSGLRSGGRLAFLCWRTAGENPWLSRPTRVAGEYIDMPPPPEPGAPGIFAFADAARVEGILAQAGFGDISIEPFDSIANLGRDPATATANILTVAPWAHLVADAGADATARLTTAIEQSFEDLPNPTGSKWRQAAGWSARSLNRVSRRIRGRCAKIIRPNSK